MVGASCSQWIACSPMRKGGCGRPLNSVVRCHQMSDVLGWRISGLVTAALVGVLCPVLLLEPWMDIVAFSMLPVGTRLAVFILPLIAVWMAVVIVFVDA